MNDSRTSPAHVIIAWVCCVLTLGYFLPWAIAATRGKSNAGAIGLLNFLLGWTAIGWIVALVMACGAHQAVSTAHATAVAPQYPRPYPQAPVPLASAHQPAPLDAHAQPQAPYAQPQAPYAAQPQDQYAQPQDDPYAAQAQDPYAQPETRPLPPSA